LNLQSEIDTTVEAAVEVILAAMGDPRVIEWENIFYEILCKSKSYMFFSPRGIENV
jgi:hypothetical protein